MSKDGIAWVGVKSIIWSSGRNRIIDSTRRSPASTHSFTYGGFLCNSVLGTIRQWGFDTDSAYNTSKDRHLIREARFTRQFCLYISFQFYRLRNSVYFVANRRCGNVTFDYGLSPHEAAVQAALNSQCGRDFCWERGYGQWFEISEAGDWIVMEAGSKGSQTHSYVGWQGPEVETKTHGFWEVNGERDGSLWILSSLCEDLYYSRPRTIENLDLVISVARLCGEMSCMGMRRLMSW